MAVLLAAQQGRLYLTAIILLSIQCMYARRITAIMDNLCHCILKLVAKQLANGLIRE